MAKRARVISISAKRIFIARLFGVGIRRRVIKDLDDEGDIRETFPLDPSEVIGGKSPRILSWSLGGAQGPGTILGKVIGGCRELAVGRIGKTSVCIAHRSELKSQREYYIGILCQEQWAPWSRGPASLRRGQRDRTAARFDRRDLREIPLSRLIDEKSALCDRLRDTPNRG